MQTAYQNSHEIKDQMLAIIAAHAEADKIIKGRYWGDGKGCAVGCTLESWRQVRSLSRINHENHEIYDEIYGPGGQMIGRLEDRIFEGLPNDKAIVWPGRFAKAIQPGADLSRVGWKFLHWLLTDEKVNPGINGPLVKGAVKQCADVLVPLTKGLPVDESAAESAAESAESAARSAAWSARSAAWSAAYEEMSEKLLRLLRAARA